MDCEQFRQRIEEDPARVEARLAEHERYCAACAAYARRVRAAERLIGAALRFDVSNASGHAAASATRRRGRPIATAWVMAASAAAAAIAVWLGLTFVPSDDPVRLVAAVQEHWYHEPDAWVQTRAPVAAPALEAALAGQARVDLERLSVVSYAQSCLVNGRWVPHLVVQGESGPVMVLLLPREDVPGSLPLELPEPGLRGVIMPLDQGSVAILATDEERLEQLQRDVSAAVDWTI